jgi:hypothetical protein
MSQPERNNVISAHNAPRFTPSEDMQWETLRFPGRLRKMLFHPSAGSPTKPNAGLVRYEPGAGHPGAECICQTIADLSRLLASVNRICESS